jgi:alkanesulfonate monooxygenase SsuD/methylene tetrahydromethanopterin reductase-like flavin-dependent oxidoreductase (luciferase family)
MSDRLRFGIFLAPFHAIAGNPTVALQRDLELIQHLDRLDYDEVWVGEHHSCGHEIIASPEIFIASAAERTRHIRLGTGVLSVPYHNPLWVADRMILLDHLTRGRAMFGAGPGALPTDAHMVGIQPSEQRRMLEEGMEAIMHLLTSDEPLTMETDWFTLREAKAQLPPYSDPLFDVAVAAIASPSGPRIAGRHGVGLLSIGATLQMGADVLALHWDVMEERAQEFGQVADRSKWRLVGVMHCAETREQAMRDVGHGVEDWFEYLQQTAAAPQFCPEGDTLQERIAWANETGVGAIGTPDDVVNQIEALWKQSGGFGAYLCMAHDWANPQATLRSYELLSQYVFPVFQGQKLRLLDAERRAQAVRAELNEQQAAAIEAATVRHQQEHDKAG